MKSKKTLLSICAAGAMVFATMFTYAAWIKLSDTVTSEPVTISEGGVIDGEQIGTIAKAGFDTSETENSLTQTTKFTVSGINNNAYDQITLAAVVKNGSNVIDASNYDVVYSKAGSPLTDGVDKSITTSGGENTYTIAIKPKANSTAATAFTGNITIETTGTLSKSIT